MAAKPVKKSSRQRVRVAMTELPVALNKDEVGALMERSGRWVEDQVAKGVFPIPRVKGAPGLLFSRKSVEEFLARVTLAPMAKAS